MKATAIVTAAALAFGAAAFAQVQDNTSRTENSANADAVKPADDAARTKNGLKKLGQKTRNALHRVEDKVRHAKADRDHDRNHARHARADRHDTRAMGAAGRDARDARDMRDADTTRRQRMDAAYDNWKKKNG